MHLHNNHPSLIVEQETVLSIIERGDAFYEAEAELKSFEAIKSFDILTKRSDLNNKIIDDINIKIPGALSWRKGVGIGAEDEDKESKASSMGNEDKETDDVVRHQHKAARQDRLT